MTNYDWESGLVFDEIIVRQPTKIHVPWDRRCPRGRPECFSRHGAASLFKMAMRQVIIRIHDVPLETIRSLPPLVVDKIWDAVQWKYAMLRQEREQ